MILGSYTKKSLEDNTIDQNEYKKITDMYNNYSKIKNKEKELFFSIKLNFFSNNKFTLIK